MNRDKQIEEMAKVYEEARCKANETLGSMNEGAPKWYAKELYNAGYRKADEVAREIFEEIENAHEECIHIDPSTNIGYLLQSKFEHKLAELKKKYTESEKDDGIDT